MAKTDDRARQRKREKHEKRKQQAKQRAKQRELPQAAGALVRLASTRPFGPAWVSACYDETGPVSALTQLTVVVTRKLPGGLLLAELVLVDRACLGIKNALVMAPAGEHELGRRVAELAERMDDRLRPCELLLAQSIVFHALDHARRLGFAPHADFHAAMFEPRPPQLLATHGARPERPVFIRGPHDDARRILRRLDASVGRGNYDCVLFHDDDGDGNLDRDWGDVDPDLDDLDPDLDDLVEAASIDWQAAVDGVPTEDLFEGLHLDLSGRAAPDPFALQQAVETFVSALDDGTFLRWEAVVREEQGLPLSAAHEQALHDLGSLHDEDHEDDEPVHWIDDCARPNEPWYATLRRLAPRLVLDRFVTSHGNYADEERWGADVLAAVERHAAELSLPPECTDARDVLPSALWHRLKVQPIFGLLSGVGQSLPDGRVISLADPSQHERIADVVTALREHADDLAALGWGLPELLEVVVLPDADRRTLLDAVTARQLATADPALALAGQSSRGSRPW